MNSMKTLAMVAVLAAVAYGVYTTLNRNARAPATPPPGGWPAGPPQEMPDLAAFTPKLGDPMSADAGVGGVPPIGAAMGTPDVSTGIPSIEAVSAGSYAPGGPVGDPAAAPSYGIGQAPPANPNWPESPVGTAPEYPTTGGAAPPADQSSAMSTLDSAPEYPATEGSAPPAGMDSRAQFEDLMRAVDRELEAGRLADAHLALSSLHGNPNLPVEMRERVIELLDQLAGSVIYSREHHLEEPYVVKPGDTIQAVAAQYDVPATLLARINGLDESQELQPGQQLKVIRGPFSATIDLDKYELTLMLGRRYAGRFPIGVGQDHVQLEGTYTVQQKVVDPPCNGPEGTIPGAAPNNPLGRYYIDLGNYVGIHGTNDTRDLHRTAGRGAIRLGDRDIDDLYGILSVGSEVVIRR